MYAENRLSHNWLVKRLVNTRVRARLADLRGVVVDLGCGERPFERDIMQHADSYLGVDWGNTLHELRADVVADLNGPLPLSSELADHVVSFEVLEHLAEPGVMLREAHRLLRPGGELTLSVPFQWWVHESPWDYYRYTRHGLEYQLRKAGFEDVHIVPTSGFWSMWVLKLNYQLFRLVRGTAMRRLLMQLLLVPWWWITQVLAPLADRVWPEENETVGYFATARKL